MAALSSAGHHPAQPQGGGSERILVQRNIYWPDGNWGPSQAEPPQLGTALTTYWETRDATPNNLYATKSAAFDAALRAVGVRDQAAVNNRWKWKRSSDDIQTLYPDPLDNETRVVVNHPKDSSKDIDRVRGHHGQETERRTARPVDHYHAGVYAGRVFTQGTSPDAAWHHAVIEHFYVRPREGQLR